MKERGECSLGSAGWILYWKPLWPDKQDLKHAWGALFQRHIMVSDNVDRKILVVIFL